MAEVVGEDPRLVKQTGCRSCAAIIRYTESEVTQRVKRDYLGDADTIHEIKCPRCQAAIVVRVT